QFGQDARHLVHGPSSEVDSLRQPGRTGPEADGQTAWESSLSSLVDSIGTRSRSCKGKPWESWPVVCSHGFLLPKHVDGAVRVGSGEVAALGRAAGDALHGQGGNRLLLDGVDPHDVLVADPGGGAGLAQEALACRRGGRELC